jgi:hypothetical protein
MVLESNAQAHGRLLMDGHRRNLGRKMPSGLEAGAKTSSPRWAWGAIPQSLRYCSASPLALAALYG